MPQGSVIASQFFTHRLGKLIGLLLVSTIYMLMSAKFIFFVLAGGFFTTEPPGKP